MDKGGEPVKKRKLSPEALERMREGARKGGRNGHTGGFYANRELARTAGAKGGSISRKGRK